MSQEHNPITTTTTIRKQRRARQRRNHPVLVTATEAKDALPQTDELSASGDSEQEVEATTTAKPTLATKAKPLSRLPKFFSKVDNSEQQEEDVIKARLARANNDKAGKASTVKENAKQNTQPQSKREPLFKIRHFVGMTLYLFGAELILPRELALAHQLGMDRGFPVTIFNWTIQLSSALFLNIATLIIFLYLLVKFDLLPNTASTRSRAEQRAKERQSKNSNNAGPVVKNVPPPIRSGVQGQDDDLYKAYRANQRREKKR